VGGPGMRDTSSVGIGGEGRVTVRDGLDGEGSMFWGTIVIDRGREGVGSGGEIKGGVVTVVGEGLDMLEAIASQEGGKLWSSILRKVPGSKS